MRKATGWKAGMVSVGSGEPPCVPTSMLAFIYQSSTHMATWPECSNKLHQMLLIKADPPLYIPALAQHFLCSQLLWRHCWQFDGLRTHCGFDCVSIMETPNWKVGRALIRVNYLSGLNNTILVPQVGHPKKNHFTWEKSQRQRYKASCVISGSEYMRCRSYIL